MGKWDKYAVEDTVVAEGGSKWDKYAVEETVTETPAKQTINETVTDIPAESSIPTVTMDANDGLVPEGSGEFNIKNPTKATGVINIPKGGVTSVALQVEQDKYNRSPEVIAENQKTVNLQDSKRKIIEDNKTKIRNLGLSTSFAAANQDPMEGQQQQQIEGGLPGNAVEAAPTDFETGLNEILNPKELSSTALLDDNDRKELLEYADKINKYAPAIQQLGKQLEQAPDDVKTLNDLADNLSAIDDKQTALSLYSKANAIKENGQSLMGLGNVYLQAGQDEEAIKAFSEAFDKDGNPDALIKAAYTGSRMDNFEGSDKILKEVKKEFPNYSYSYALSAYNKEASGDVSGAKVDNAIYENLRQMELLPESVNADDPNSDYAKERASQQARMGNVAAAIATPINFFGEMEMGAIKGGIKGLKKIGQGAYDLAMPNSAIVGNKSDDKIGAILNIANGAAETVFSGAMAMTPVVNAGFHMLPESVNKVLMQPLNVIGDLSDEELASYSKNTQGMFALGNTLASILLLGAVHKGPKKFTAKENEAILNIVKGEAIEGEGLSLKGIVNKAKKVLEESKLTDFQDAEKVWTSIPKELSTQDKLVVAPDLIKRERLQEEMAKASPAFKNYFKEKIDKVDEDINAKLSINLGLKEQAAEKTKSAEAPPKTITNETVKTSKVEEGSGSKQAEVIRKDEVGQEVLIPEYSEKLKDVSPETKVVDLPDGISVEFNGEKGTIGRSETGETLFINAEGKETIVGGGGDVSTLAEKGISRTEGTYSDKRGDYYVKDGRVFEVTKDGLKPVYEGEKANVERKEAIIRKALNPEKPKEKIVEPVVEEKPIEVKLEEIKTEPVAETPKVVADTPSSRPIEKFESEVAFEEAGSGHNVLFTDKDGKKSVVGKVFGTEGKTGAEFDSWVKPQIEAIHYKEVVKAVERGDVVPKEVLDHYLSSKIEGDYNGMLAEAIKSVKENGPKKEIFSEQEIGEVMDKRAEELSQMKRTKDYVFQLIHDNFGGITEAQWNRFGDSGWLKGKEGKKFRKKYIKNDAGKTDTNDFGSFSLSSGEGSSIEITPQNVVDYIMDREFNPKKYDGRLKQWDDAASIPKKDVPSLLSGDDAMVLSIAESNRGLGMTDLEVDTIKRYVESKAKNEARAKNTKPRSAESTPKSEGVAAKSERVGRKPGEKAQKKKDEAKSVKAEESKYVEAEKKISKIFETLREKLKSNAPEGTQKMGVGLEDLLNAAEKVIIGAIRAGEKIDVAISKGLDHLKEKWDDSFGEFPEKELRDILKENGEIQLSHEKIDALREKHGLEEREINDPVSVEKTRAEAQKIIKKGFDVIKLSNDVLKKERTITPVERAILAERVAILNKELLEGDTASPEYAKKLEELDKISKAAAIANSAAGSSLGSIAHLKVVPDESLAGYFQEQRRVNKEGALTEKQTATNKKEFEEITKVKEAYEKKIAKLQEDNNRLKAEKQLEKLSKKTSKRTAKEKLDEDFDLLAKEFSSIAKNTLNAGINPELIPVVLKMVKNRVEKGVITLSEVVDAVHEKVGEFGISKEDIIAAIAGKSGVERTRSEVAKNGYELKQEARLVQKLMDLQNGKEPSSERGKIQKNARLEELRKQIKEHDLTKLAEYKKRLDAQIAEVERELATGDFAKEEKAEPFKLDKETLELQDKYMQLSMEREARLLKEEYAQRSKSEKAGDIALSLLNAPMTLMSGGDLSAVLRQGLVASTAHPILAARAGKQMLKFFKSQRDFDRWHFETKKNPRYLGAKEAGLAIIDPHDPRLSAREELFTGNIVEKIPLYGGPIKLAKIKDGKLVRTEGKYGGVIKSSERAYVGFLNKMRWDVYNQFAERLEARGITFENSPTTYKKLASYVNDSTGRGNVSKGIERLAPALNATFFSPRLWASRLKLLSNWANPWWYKNVPAEVRRFYWEDMGKFTATVATVYFLSKMNGQQVETDIRSSDFLKIRDGKKRYDILGGFQQPIRTLGQYATGQKKDIDSGEITELTDKDKSLPNRLLEQKRLAVLLQHIRGKLSPVPAAFTDFGMGRMMDYSEPTVEKEIMRMIVPLAWQDITSAYGEEGAKAFLTTGVPTMLGISASTYKDRPKEETAEKPDKPEKPKKKKRNRSGFN